MSFSNLTVLVALASTAACYILWKNKRSDIDSLLPPRAPGYIPIIGHILELIRPIPIHELFYKWSLQVGPVFTCYFGTQKWIVINSIEAVRDLIVERGTIYSSRNLPDTIIQDIFQGDKGGSFAFMTYGPRWRHLRRIAHSGLIENKIDLYQPILNERRTALLSYIYKLSEEKKEKDKGIDISYFIEHYTMTSILTIAFGDICSFEPEDPTLHKAFNLTERASKALSPGDQVREFFPILQMLWPAEKTRYFQLRDDIVQFYETLLNQFRAQKSTQDCFVKEIMKENELNDLQIIYFIALFVGAGSDTTASTIEWAISYLANHPEVQDLAYNEIKEEVGLDRLPQSYDVYKTETLRIRPPAPTAIPHATSEDDVYKGWHIPKNTVILMNLFAIHNNPSRFPNPSQFQPERHLEYVQESQHNHKFSQVIEDRPHLGFSTGRRVCVGIHLAERKLFMAISMLLACFKIERISEDLIDVNAHKDIHGVTWAIPHYKIQLVPRHDKVKTFFK